MHCMQLTRLCCPSLSPGVCSDSCLLSWWYYPTISSFAANFFLPSVFPSIKVFSNELAFHIRCPNYWIFSFSPSNDYSELISFTIDCWILLSKGLSRVLSNMTDQEHQFLGTQPSLMITSWPRKDRHWNLYIPLLCVPNFIIAWISSLKRKSPKSSLLPNSKILFSHPGLPESNSSCVASK